MLVKISVLSKDQFPDHVSLGQSHRTSLMRLTLDIDKSDGWIRDSSWYIDKKG